MSARWYDRGRVFKPGTTERRMEVELRVPGCPKKGEAN
jgi:hypothetical protein